MPIEINPMLIAFENIGIEFLEDWTVSILKVFIFAFRCFVPEILCRLLSITTSKPTSLHRDGL